MITNKRLAVVNNEIREHSGVKGTSKGLVASKSRSTASLMGGMSGGSSIGSNVQVGGYTGATQYGRTLDNIMPDQSEESLIPFYRDIYYHDAIGGSACDLTATFPFSEWTLSGVDNKIVNHYTEAMSRLNVRTLMPEIALSYLVDGDFIGTLVYDKEIRNFSDLFVHDRMYCQVFPSPFYSMDPLITAQPSARLKQFMSTNSPYAKQLLKNYPEKLINGFTRGAVELDPLTTLHVARRGLNDRMNGSTSYLKRLIPIYLLEKAMYRGTLVETSKRMRATTHVMAGDDVWEPTNEELEDLTARFQATENDPLGAWIVTRQGVQVSDVRQAGDFFKWTDVAEQLTTMKLRALCISEAFLAGDANFSTSENALTVFLENIETFRSFLTYRVFNYKLFPLIAVANGLYKKGERPPKNLKKQDLVMDIKHHKSFDIPKIVWHKELVGRDGPSKMEMLNTLAEKGFPISLRTWATAAGLDIGALLNDLDEETELRKQLAEYDKAIKATGFDPGAVAENMSATGEDGDSDGMADDSSFELASMGQAQRRLQQVQRNIKRVGLGKRTFANEDVGAHKLGKTGKPQYVHNEHTFMKKQNEMLVKAMANLQDPNNRAKARERVVRTLGGVPNIL